MLFWLGNESSQADRMRSDALAAKAGEYERPGVAGLCIEHFSKRSVHFAHRGGSCKTIAGCPVGLQRIWNTNAKRVQVRLWKNSEAFSL